VNWTIVRIKRKKQNEKKRKEKTKQNKIKHDVEKTLAISPKRCTRTKIIRKS
jgi:hypothetical protein